MDIAELVIDLETLNTAAIRDLAAREHELKAQIREARTKAAATEALNRLQTAARADRSMAEQVNKWLLSAARLPEVLASWAAAGDPFQAAQQMRSDTDTCLIAMETARYAAKVAQGYANGKELAVVANTTARDAFRRVVYFPADVLRNGTAGTCKAGDLYDAVAARNFLREFGSAYAFVEGNRDFGLSLADVM